MNVSRWFWAVTVGLLLVSAGAVLAAAPGAVSLAPLLTIPLLLAARRFGLRGAVIASSASVLIVAAALAGAGVALGEARFVAWAGAASPSPDDPRSAAPLAARPQEEGATVPLVWAMSGMTAAVIASLTLGVATDRRERSERLLRRAVNGLSGRVSPQAVAAILAQDGGRPPTLAPARREVTILSADLRGFSALSERLPAEETVRLLNEFLSAMSDEVARQDGTLDKHVGNTLTAYFGDQTLYPDHAARAFRAALVMQQRVADLRRSWPASARDGIGVAIGVSTGAAVLGVAGPGERQEFTVIGVTVNIAARLTDLAQSGQIITTRKTYWRAQHLVSGAARERTRVEGFAHPVEIIEVTGLRDPVRAPIAPPPGRFGQTVARLMSDPVVAAMLTADTGQDGASEGLSVEERDRVRALAGLADGPLLRGAPAVEVSGLGLAATLLRLDEATVLTRQGEPGETFYLIVEGEVLVTILNDEGQELLVALLGAGDCFGEIALLYDTPRNATVRTAGPARLMALDRERFYETLLMAPTLRERIENAARSRIR